MNFEDWLEDFFDYGRKELAKWNNPAGVDDQTINGWRHPTYIEKFKEYYNDGLTPEEAWNEWDA